MIHLTESADRHAARKLGIYIQNDYPVYQHLQTARKNLMAKQARNQFDAQKAVKAFMYVVDMAAKKYAKEHTDSSRWNTMFTKPTRIMVAQELAIQFQEAVAIGEYNYLLPKKYRKESVVQQHSRLMEVALPSESEDGKPSYDTDFIAGWNTAKKAYAANNDIDSSTAERAYRRVSQRHGSWWIAGYTAYIDTKRGAHATSGSRIAKKLNLKESTMKQHPALLESKPSKLSNGYAYKYNGKDWKHSSDEDWDTVAQSGGSAKFVGYRMIDNAKCAVFKKGNYYYAQMAHMVESRSNLNESKLDLSHGFSAGNYANAYKSENFKVASRGVKQMRNPAYRAGFILGFYASYELDEIPADMQDEYEEALYSSYGKMAKQLGYID